jgi:hypothetical protein
MIESEKSSLLTNIIVDSAISSLTNSGTTSSSTTTNNNTHTNYASTDDIPAQRHLTACFFHLFFKGSAIFVYLFCNLIFGSFVLAFVTSVLLLAFDFWTVKNITGRLLVGLRWWNEVKSDGTNVWIFESNENRPIHSMDSFLFWSALYGFPCVWLFFAIAAFLTLQIQWLLIGKSFSSFILLYIHLSSLELRLSSLLVIYSNQLFSYYFFYFCLNSANQLVRCAIFLTST